MFSSQIPTHFLMGWPAGLPCGGDQCTLIRPFEVSTGGSSGDGSVLIGAPSTAKARDSSVTAR